jgi:F-type H+-transporting ATPase subunit a
VRILRPILIGLLVLAPIVISYLHSPHHSEGSPLALLYGHLMPVRLVHHEQQEYLLSIHLPASLKFFDMDPAREGVQLVLTNLQLFQLAAVLLIFACFWGVPRYLRTGEGDSITRFFSGMVLFVRDGMVFPAMGRERGAKFLPFFLTLGCFILFMNLMGLLPFGATATASIFVTGAMAAITFVAMLVCGMVAQGPIAYWKHLVPHVPLALWPLMFVVELIGLLVKPFALMVRLFANMNGGHLVVLSLTGLIFVFGSISPTLGYASSVGAVGFAVFILIIEAFVALVQAYIFTQLSILFVSASVHPEH